MKDSGQTQGLLKSMVEMLATETQQMKKLGTTIESMVDEHKSLSTKVTLLNKELKETQAENKEMSEQVEKVDEKVESLAKGLTGLIKLQAKDILALRNSLTQMQKHISKEASTSRADDSTVEETGTGFSKRIVLHSDTDILSLVTFHGTEIQKLQTDVAALKAGLPTRSAELQKLQTDIAVLKSGMPKGGSGSTYVRWGKNNCSGNGTELVYSGYAAGSDYQNSGAAANYICLSPDPLWGHYNDAHDADAKVLGVEYELYGAAPGDTTAFFHKNLHEEDAPCSVCRSTRSTVLMIPGRNQCYSGWTLEYKGYLVAGYYGHAAATEYVCLDDNPEVIPGGHADEDGSLFYMVEGRCGRSLTCPPYVDGRELTCVVCSK